MSHAHPERGRSFGCGFHELKRTAGERCSGDWLGSFLLVHGGASTLRQSIRSSRQSHCNPSSVMSSSRHPTDPAPPTTGTMSFSDFYDLVKGQNNITWRNFNVVNVLPDLPSVASPFEFLINGADGRPELFEFEVERKLPRDAQLIFEGPVRLILQLRRPDQDVKIDRKKKAGQMVLPSLPRGMLGSLRLGNGDRYLCRLRLIPGKTKIAWGHGVAVRQLYRGEEMGRVTWQFAPEVSPCGDKERKNP
jgi:hypothetical protein